MQYKVHFAKKTMKSLKIILCCVLLATLFSCSLNHTKIGSVPINVKDIYKQVRDATGATNEQIKIEITVVGDKGYSDSRSIENSNANDVINGETIKFEGIQIGETVTFTGKIFIDEIEKYTAEPVSVVVPTNEKVVLKFVPVTQNTDPTTEPTDPTVTEPAEPVDPTATDPSEPTEPTVTIEIPEGFVFVEGTTISTKIEDSNVFIEGRNLVIQDFIMCVHEVTQGEYEYPQNTTLRYGEGENYPAYLVSWYAAIVYCNKRSINEDLTPCYSKVVNNRDSTNPDEWGSVPTDVNNSSWNAIKCNFEANGYRLPTEVEWEYAAHGGKNGIVGTQFTYAGSDTIDDVAWYSGNSNTKTYEVTTKKPNALGLYGMSGNVAEWCWDLSNTISSNTPATGPTSSSAAGARVYRGGSYNDGHTSCTVFYRPGASASSSQNTIGLRVVRSWFN